MTLQRLVVSLIVGGAALTSGPSARAQAATSSCAVSDVEYALAANLKLSDTPMGQGDGVYRIGPGSVVLRIDSTSTPAKVQMLHYRMGERFTIRARALFWSTTVETNTATTTTPDSRGVVASGVLAGSSLQWTSDVLGYRTDGTLSCSGSLCGKFGAPPPGTTPLHIAPHPVRFKPFVFAPDLKTFTMASTFVTKTESPKQTAHVQLAGSEVRRTCAD